MGCLTKIGCVVVLAAGAAAGAWLYGDRLPAIAGKAARRAGTEAVDLAIKARFDSTEAARRLARREAQRAADARAADSALGWVRIAAVPPKSSTDPLAPLRRAKGRSEVAMTTSQVAALLAPLRRGLPASATTLSLALTETELLLRADLARSDFAVDAALRQLLDVTLDGRDTLDLAGTVELVRPGLAQYRVTRLAIEGFEVPPRFVPVIVGALRGRQTESDAAARAEAGMKSGADTARLAPEALPIPVPRAIREIRLTERRLVFSRDTQPVPR